MHCGNTDKKADSAGSIRMLEVWSKRKMANKAVGADDGEMPKGAKRKPFLAQGVLMVL